jgi:predicted dehydrogenase
MLREAGTHYFDRVRFLTGQELRRVAGRLTPWTAAPWPVPEAAGADADLEYALLAELGDGALASLRLTLTAVAGEEQTVLSGVEGVLTVSPQGALRQRVGEATAAALEIPPACGRSRSSPRPSAPMRSAAGSTSPSWTVWEPAPPAARAGRRAIRE